MGNVQARYPDEAYVSIARIDDLGSEYNGTTDIMSWSESGFGQPVSSDQLWGNAKVIKREPQEDGEVQFEIVITNNEWSKIFWNASGSDFTSGSSRQKYRVTLLITDADTITPLTDEAGSASGSISNSSGAYSVYRIVYADAYCTGFEPEMSADEYLKGTVTFTLAATDDSGAGNRREQVSTEDTVSWAALGSYTTASKW